MRLIDADELIKHACRSTEWSHGEHPMVVEVDDIDDAPTIEAEPVRHGKWIDITESHIGTCSLCGDRWGSVDMMNYCPNCGALMDGEVEGKNKK